MNAEDIVLIAIVYGGVVLAVFWLAMVIWAYRDMRARSRDFLAQVAVVVLVAVLGFPGLLVYVLLRPRETLGEAYERSLEEEALLQEIEDKPVCPGCGQRVQDKWQVCAYCHTRLKKPCFNCGSLLDLSWNICPVCAVSQQTYTPDNYTGSYSSRPANLPEQPPEPPQRQSQPLEYIEGDDYVG